MRNGNEEIFVSLIVVRRPESPGAETINPGEWAQSVLESLRGETLKHNGALRRAGAMTGANLGSAAHSRGYDHSHGPVLPQRRTWLFVISAVCFVGAAYCFHLAV